MRKSHFFKTVPERASVSDLISLSVNLSDRKELPRRPSYRGSKKHGGGPSTQVEVIHEITDQEARHGEKSEFLDVAGCPEAQDLQTVKRPTRNQKDNLVALQNHLDVLSNPLISGREVGTESLDALLGGLHRKSVLETGPQATSCHSETVPPR